MYIIFFYARSIVAGITILICCRLEGGKKKEEAALFDGAQFLMKICQEVLQSVEHKDNNIAEFISYYNHECDQFHQWLDGVLSME